MRVCCRLTRIIENQLADQAVFVETDFQVWNLFLSIDLSDLNGSLFKKKKKKLLFGGMG